MSEQQSSNTDRQHCFAPIAGDSARILILGTFPGVMSLEKQQYYAHPRNSFWKIMASLLKAGEDHDYSGLVELLINNRIALWDVFSSCRRLGSLDSAIETDSILLNDFHWFFGTYPTIRAILFNGAVAQTSFTKHVLPQLSDELSRTVLLRLPSTSPAMASLTLGQKIEAWQVLKHYL